MENLLVKAKLKYLFMKVKQLLIVHFRENILQFTRQINAENFEILNIYNFLTHTCFLFVYVEPLNKKNLVFL